MTTKDIEIEKFITLILQEAHSIVPGAIKGRSKQGAGRERNRIWGEVLCGSPAKANWSIQTQMSRVLVRSAGALSKGHTGEGPGGEGDC